MKSVHVLLLIGAFASLALGVDPPKHDQRTIHAATEAIVLGIIHMHPKDWQQGEEVTGEVFPIAAYADGSYSDVLLAPQNNEDETPLAQLREFTLYTNEQALARFLVKEVTEVSYGCGNAIVGVGDLMGVESFEELESLHQGALVSARLVTDASRIQDGFSRIVTMNGELHQPPKLNTTQEIEESIVKKDLLGVASPILFATTFTLCHETSRELPQVMEMYRVDLDHDGSYEYCGMVKQEITGIDKHPNGSTYEVNLSCTALVWLSYEEGLPNTLLIIGPDEDEIGLTRSFHRFIDAIDINRDGNSEVILEGIGYEWGWYEIYELDGRNLRKVFNGAVFGC